MSIFPTVVVLSDNVSRRRSFDDILSLSEDFEILEIDAGHYNNAKHTLPACDCMVTIDWMKDFFHSADISCPVYHAHPSLLPKYRGYGAVSEQFMKGVVVSGVSIYEENGKVDAGDIIYQENIKILHEDIPSIFLDNCAKHVATFISNIENNIPFERTKQDESKAFYLTRNRSANRIIDFNMTAYSVYNFVRAYMYPYSGAYFYHEGERVIANSVAIESWQGDYGKPGEVIKIDDYGVEIACGDGTIILDKFSKDIEFLIGDIIFT